MQARSALCAASITVMLVTGCVGGSAAPIPAPSASSAAAIAPADPLAAVRADLAPTGKLRVAIFGPPFVGSRDATGQLHGVAVALASQLAAKLGTQAVIHVYDSPAHTITPQTMSAVPSTPS